ncbi:MAG: S8 family serine peptidase [Vitreoscilla sp.]|nr:S8 family serine peptidase [Vitreoscilla sp.]
MAAWAHSVMAADSSLLYAEPEVLLQALATPNDPMYAQQWGHFEATAGMRLPGAWDLSTGSGVVVGVLDTGYRPHADLAANIVPGYDFVTDTTIANDDGRDGDASDRGEGCSSGQRSWHCTHLAGVAALRHSRNPKLTPDEIDVACSNCGIGMVDAVASVRRPTWAAPCRPKWTSTSSACRPAPRSRRG